jgi:hypothetical protein
VRRTPCRPLALAVVLAFALAAAGCGKSDEPTAAPPEPQPTAKATDFPSAKGRSATDVLAGAAEGPVLAPSVSVVDPGRNRFGFAIFDTARKQIPGAQVAIYTARVDGTGARGPYLARSESLAVKPQFRSRTTTSDPDSAKAVYVADVPFGPRGKRAVWAMVRLDGRMLYTNAFSINVGRAAAGGETGARLAPAGTLPPRVGDRAIRVHTQTAADVGGDLSQIDTRQPPAEGLHKVDFADVLGKQPVVLTFATPLLCQSRVCGPVVDIVEQVRATAPKGIAFIHQEIYRDHEVKKGVRQQVARWHLPSEPWTFVIDRSGTITARFEGAFSAGELQRAVAKVAG